MDKNEKELLDTAKKVVKVLEKKRQIETEQKLLDLAEQMVAIYREWNPDGTNFQMSWYKDIGDRPSITVENHWADDDKYKMPMQASRTDEGKNSRMIFDGEEKIDYEFF